MENIEYRTLNFEYPIIFLYVKIYEICGKMAKVNRHFVHYYVWILSPHFKPCILKSGLGAKYHEVVACPEIGFAMGDK